MAELTLKERMRKLAQHGSAGPGAFHVMGAVPGGLANQGVLANELSKCTDPPLPYALPHCSDLSATGTVKGVSLKHAPAPPMKKEGGEEDDEPEIATMLKRVTLRPTMNKTESMQVPT